MSPPRLDGVRVGLFSTRTPHRPNPVGLSLVRLESVAGNTLTFSGVDVRRVQLALMPQIVDGSPVLDVKPYIPSYDSVRRVLPS